MCILEQHDPHLPKSLDQTTKIIGLQFQLDKVQFERQIIQAENQRLLAENHFGISENKLRYFRLYFFTE